METNVRLEPVKITVTPEITIAGVQGVPAWWPSGHRVGVVLAHDTVGAMEHEALVMLHHSLAERGYLTLRFNFPFADQGKKRPDPAPLLERTYRAAAASLTQDPQTGPARLIVGGFGLGAKVAAEAVAHGLLADGVLCLGYPLHPSGKPNRQRAEALFRIICPMLFIQGSRDPYCRIDRLEAVLRRVGAPTSLCVIEDADHLLGLIRRSMRPAEEVHDQVVNKVDTFLQNSMGGH